MDHESTGYESSSEQQFSFGKITVKVGVSGDVTKAPEFCDYMLASAAGIGEILALRKLQDGDRTNGGTKQTCRNEITFGAISISLELGFELAATVSNRTLNDIVTDINLLLWTAYGSYMGNKGGLGKRQTANAVLDNITSVLEMHAGQPVSHNGKARTAQPGRGPGHRSASSSRSRSARPAGSGRR